MAHKIDYWIIRHKPSGLTIPYAHGRMGRGGSHVKPCDPNFDRPRLFNDERYAKGWLTSWLKGKVIASRYYGEEYEETLALFPVPSRKREEMEIVKVSIKV